MAYDPGVPPPNEERRNRLADAAITLLVSAGVHGVTHRAVDAQAQEPSGTTANYFRSREALLVAAAERVVDLHLAEMSTAVRAAGGRPGDPVELLADSLLHAATTARDRYLAIFELRLESLRRPALAQAISRLMDVGAAFTAEQHRTLALEVPPEAVPLLMVTYGGALFTLVTAPPGSVTEDLARALAATIVAGATPTADAARTWTGPPPG